MSWLEEKHVEVCRVLREDPDLAQLIPARERERATVDCVARVITLSCGRWNGQLIKPLPGGIGLLVLDGVLMRQVSVHRRLGAELLGSGDLLRPWQEEDSAYSLPHGCSWSVLKPARLAVLDAIAAARFARYPTLAAGLMARAVSRSRSLALRTAIMHHPPVGARVHLFLWHLAGRWGRVRPDGIYVPIHLSHSQIADFVAAQRPSVSVALKRLERRGLLCPLDGGWVLHGEPPDELSVLRGAGAATDGGTDVSTAVAALRALGAADGDGRPTVQPSGHRLTGAPHFAAPVGGHRAERGGVAC